MATSAANGRPVITSAPMAVLVEGFDWRMPRRTRLPELAGSCDRFACRGDLLGCKELWLCRL
ncbi:MAG: hypothetical protein RLO21_18700 [Nitratireductor sp.]